MSSSKNLEYEKTSFLNKSNSAFIEQMYLKFIKKDPNLPGSWRDYFEAIGDELNVQLTYSNNGNPSSEGYLDFIAVEATRRLEGTRGQFKFSSKDAKREAREIMEARALMNESPADKVKRLERMLAEAKMEAQAEMMREAVIMNST